MEPRFNLLASPTSAKVARRFYTASTAFEESTLPKLLRELVQLRASQLNGCGWCVDVHTKEAQAAGETALRLNLLVAWRHSTVFTEAERAALALAEEGTLLTGAPGGVSGGVSDEPWEAVGRNFDEDAI